MIYGSVCSGIEAATIAWHPLGWKPAFFSEIEKFPRAVLEHHYPDIPLHGDFTTIEADQYGAIDLLAGGTPCQSFSVAGLRGGLDDDRGNLALEYLKLAERKRAQWLVWENVPGVLSSWSGEPEDGTVTEWEETSDLACFLNGLSELGYGWAYRVLDAQYFGVPQRRRRVFVVAYLGDWRPAAAVLFERESLRRDNPPSRETAPNIAGTITSGADRRRGAGQDPGSLVAFGGGANCNQTNVATAVTAHPGGRYDVETETFVTGPLCNNGKAAGSATQQDAEQNMLVCHGTQDPCVDENTAFALGRNNGGENVITFDTTQITSSENRSQPAPGKPCHTLNAGAHAPAIAISGRARGDDGRGHSRPEHISHDCAGTVDATKTERVWRPNSRVRRLTPLECERLQGFPDEWTQIPWRNKPAAQCPDGPRYKAIGNSMAVPVMSWIGMRIDRVNQILQELAA